MIAWCIALILTTTFGCTPPSFFWDKTIKGGKCIDLNTFAYGISGTNVATDLVVLFLPIPWLWGLQMKTARKIAIGGIFGVGSLYVGSNMSTMWALQADRVPASA